MSLASLFRPRLWTSSAALLIALTACATRGASPGAAVGEITMAQAKDASIEAPEPDQGLPADRDLIRRAAVDLEVEQPESVAVNARTIAQGLGGYIERSTESSGKRVHVTMRVPSAALDAAMDAVSRLGHLRSRRLSTDDVTDQIIDLDARATTLRATRDRLRRLLERTESISEIVTVERELARIQRELEVLETRLEYLRRRAAFSELAVDASPKRVLGPLGLVFKGAGTVLEKLFIWK
jgi:hypothetical protein